MEIRDESQPILSRVGLRHCHQATRDLQAYIESHRMSYVVLIIIFQFKFQMEPADSGGSIVNPNFTKGIAKINKLLELKPVSKLTLLLITDAKQVELAIN